MNSLTIEDISKNMVSIRVINTSHIYRINLNRVVRFSDIRGLSEEELLLIGVLCGKIARSNRALLYRYDFGKLYFGGNLKLKSMVFDGDVTFLTKDFIKKTIDFDEVIKEPEAIDGMSENLYFYIGFLYGAFSLSSDEIVLGDEPKPSRAGKTLDV